MAVVTPSFWRCGAELGCSAIPSLLPAFFSRGQLQKAEVAGGAPVRVADAAYAFGGTWNDDNTIIYATSLGSGLLRIPAAGGAPEPLTKPDGAAKGYAHVFPQVLPGGRRVLFASWGQTQGSAVLSLDSGRWEIVLPMPSFSSALFDATGGSSGRLLLVDQTAGVRAAPFDPANPALTSADATVLDNVYFDVETEIVSNLLPLWSRDGLRIIFASNRGGDWDIYSQPPDGSRPAEVVLKRPNDQFPYSILPDGTLIYTEIQPTTGRDMWTLSPDGKASPVRVTPFNELAPQFSPGPAGGPRWVAYASDESGRSEVYVQSYPGGENRIAVSTGGGILPMWSPDGKELFYLTGGAMMAVAMRPDGAFGAPRRLFDRSTFLINDRFHSYSVSPDGKRFLMIQREPGSVPRQLNVMLNWQGELNRLLPTK